MFIKVMVYFAVNPVNEQIYYLWHIDGNHKLVRWGLVIHHEIDGFSRLVTFCRCSGNNKSTTVFPLFNEAVQWYDRPIHDRTDDGGENVLVWRDMVDFWCQEAQSVIVGSPQSAHWALNEQVISIYRKELYELESEGHLHPSNPTDLFCVHYVYLGRIQKACCEFVAAYNNHCVSTKEQLTPVQMFWANVHLFNLLLVSSIYMN